MTSGTIHFAVDGVEGCNPPDELASGYGGLFNCGMTGFQFQIWCDPACDVDFAINKLYLYESLDLTSTIDTYRELINSYRRCSYPDITDGPGGWRLTAGFSIMSLYIEPSDPEVPDDLTMILRSDFEPTDITDATANYAGTRMVWTTPAYIDYLVLITQVDQVVRLAISTDSAGTLTQDNVYDNEVWPLSTTALATEDRYLAL
jgi:hypothetical protein